MAPPAFAADPPAGTADKDNNPSTRGPKEGLPAKAKAYRRYCKDQSKKHEEGENGTPFSRCVTHGAKLLRDQKAHDEESEQ